jgi:hypothetical protein
MRIIAPHTEAPGLTLAQLGVTPIDFGSPPYPRAFVLRVKHAMPEHGIGAGDLLVVDRDGSIVVVIHGRGTPPRLRPVGGAR